MGYWRPLCTSVLLLLATMASVAQVAPQPASDVEAVTRLMARGMVGESPVIQSIIGAEFGGKVLQGGEENTTGAANALLSLKDARNQDDPAAPMAASDARQVPIKIGQRLQENRAIFLQSQTGIAAMRAARSSLGAAGFLAENLSAPPPRLADTTARVQAGTQTIAASEQIAYQAKGLESQYRQVVQGVLVLAAIHAASSKVDSYTPDMMTKANVKDVLQVILGANNAHVPTDVTQALGNLTLTDIANAPYDVVSQAIGEYTEKRLNNQLGALDTQWTGYIATTGSSISKKVSDMRNQLEASADYLQRFSSALEAETDSLTHQAVAVSAGISTSADMIIMRPEDNALWGQLSPQEKLAALDEGAFANNGVDMAELRESLVNATQVQDARDKALTALSRVGELGNLAASLGVPVDTYNLTKNIDTAATAINVAASIATGNWVGALSEGSGLLGGGSGPSAEQIELSRLSKKLDEVIDLQKKTLAKIEELSRQLQDSTDSIMKQLAVVRRMVASVIAFEEEQSKIDFYDCEKFVLRASQKKYSMVNGLFPTYQQRVQHFYSQEMPEDYNSCISYLGRVKDIKQGAADKDYINTIFVSQALNAATDTSSNDMYQNMLSHTIHLLGAGELQGSKPNCLRRMTWAAALGARYFSDLNIHELSCGLRDDTDISEQSLHCTKAGASDGTGECRKLRFTETSPDADAIEFPFNQALGPSVVPENVQEIGEMLLFFTPYASFMRKNEYGQPTFLQQDELAKDALPGEMQGRPDNVALYEWPAAFLNVVNMAVAQQTIASGVLATEATARLLQQSHYGSTATFPTTNPDGDSNLKDDVSRVAMKSFVKHGDIQNGFPSIYNYAATLWLLQNNPTYAVNFMRYFVTKRLFENKVTRPEYSMALKSSNINFVSEMLKDNSTQDVLPLEYRNNAGRNGWNLVLRQQDGSAYYLPLPSATAVWANNIAYPESAEGLFTLRNALLDRVLLAMPNSLDLVNKVDPSAARLLRQEALADHLIGNSRITLGIYQLRAGRDTLCVKGACTHAHVVSQSISQPNRHFLRAE
ncbi:hypothetical protein [Burkholderia ambifaria]|uniref:hypothetical protein n=1 Tax=Burkholderia ambifaria TaxID=152480 RepID=UPI000F810A4E|nr:hypothetical protein [Burkholderia ambifaria]